MNTKRNTPRCDRPLLDGLDGFLATPTPGMPQDRSRLAAIQCLIDALCQFVDRRFPNEDGPGALALNCAIRADEAMRMTGDKRSQFYARLNKKSPSYDPTFPRPFYIGRSPRWWPNKVIGWLEIQSAAGKQVGGHHAPAL